MEIKKPNDILVATINNPELTPYDLLSNNITGENTSLLSKDAYKQSKYIQDTFKQDNGKFDDAAFNEVYKMAQNKFYNLTNEQYLKELDEVKYSPFDVTRPKFAKTFSVSAKMEKEYNPFEVRKGWTGIGSEDSSPLSLREIAQKNKIFDPATKSWSKNSLNDLSIMDKLFGDTLVYAQWDTDGQNLDPATGMMINHKKGDWKVNDDGNLFIEKLGDRQVYGKQVVNSMDTLTTDGSLVNQFDFFDSDGREKSITGTVFKLAATIAPTFIPGVGTYYGGIRAAVGLASVLPTFYKSIEGLLIGDKETALTKAATGLENYMAKYTAKSTSDEGSQGMFNFEQTANMVGDIFTQIYEQRAMASLSKYIMRGDKLVDKATQEMAEKINTTLLQDVLKGKISMDDLPGLSKAAMEKIPELQSVIKKQSQLSKALSLGYMAVTSTGDIYGEALANGYSRRAAGFASLATAAGQYSIMMNNKMGDWFLDKTTGYSNETSRAMTRKAVLPWMDEIQGTFDTYAKNPTAAKKALAGTFGKIRNSIGDIFTTPSVLGEAMWKNALIEGVEEVTEQAVQDATEGIVDTMSYLGIFERKKNTVGFGGWSNVFSKEGAETYLANLVGGVIGGGLFELQRSKIMPLLDPHELPPNIQKSVYELIAGGQKEEVIKTINKERKRLGNKYITPINEDGSFQEVSEDNAISQADLVADKAIDMVNIIDGIINNHDLGKSDEEIVNKAIRDKLIIDRLKAATPEGKNIGLEGLVLEDYKNRMTKIINLQSQINSLQTPSTVTPQAVAEAATKGTSEAVKTLQDELKINIDAVNEIMEGNVGPKYFRQATFYLDKKINKAFLHADKNSFSEATYGVKYSELPDKGSGAELSKDRVDQEWNKYINSKDLRNDLDTADKIYTQLESLLNPSIADYVESGYGEERKRTLDNIVDLKGTIKLFNTASSESEKAKLLEHFIYVNNELEKDKKGIVSPWTVFQNDMYTQLKSLGLVKKLGYSMDENNLVTETLDDFKESDLGQIIAATGATKEEANKNMVQEFFKKFPMNPLNAEKIIDTFNSQVRDQNQKTLKQIADLKAKPEQDEETLQKIENLQNSLIDIKIDSFTNTAQGKGLQLTAQNEIDTLLKNKNITPEQLDKYINATRTSGAYDKSFDEMVKEIGAEDWKALDVIQLNALLDNLMSKGTFSLVMDSLVQTSEDAENIINNAITQLKNPDITPEEFDIVKGNLERFFDVAKSNISTNIDLLSNDDYSDIQTEINKINNKLSSDLDKMKPELLKMHNYAFDLLLSELQSGSADKELFIEAQRLYKEELNNILADIFPNATDIKLEDLPEIFKSTKLFQERLQDSREMFEAGDDSAYNGNESLSDVIKNERNLLENYPDEESVLIDSKFIEFLEKNFSGSTTIGSIVTALNTALINYNNSKPALDRLNKFNELTQKGLSLKSNALYDFIRKFFLTLNSNPKSKVNTIIDILEREETTLKSASNITNYTSDGVREQDLNQAIDQLEMIKSVVYAMSTTEVDFEDPIGFIAARQKYAKDNKLEDEVLNLKTITSDTASLMIQDLDALQTKLQFLKDLTKFNAGKMMNEQEIIRGRVEGILLDNWKSWASKMNPSFCPPDKIKEILTSSDSNSKKLMKIENLIFDTNVDKKEDALLDFLKHFSMVDSDNGSKVDKEVKALTAWDLSIYLATTLAMRSEDFHTRSYLTVISEFPRAPFFTQEFSSKIAKAHTINPMLFSKIFEIHPNSSKAMCDFITVITGGAGTGKTSSVFGFFLDNIRQTNENSNIWLVAPADLQTNNLDKAIKDTIGSNKVTTTKSMKSELFAKLGITDLVNEIKNEVENILDDKVIKRYVKLVGNKITLSEELLSNDWLNAIAGNFDNLPNLLLIDEVTHFSAAELYLLNAISKFSYTSDSTNFMKIIAAGDPSQLGNLVEISGNYFSYNIDSINAIFTPKLQATVRASNNQKRLNNDRLSRVTEKITSVYEESQGNYGDAEKQSNTYLDSTQELNTLSYYEIPDALAGDKIVKSLDAAMVSRLKAIVDKDPTVIIGILTSDGNLPEEWNALLSNVGLVNPDGLTDNIRLFSPTNIQGNEVDYFIFDANLTTKYDKLRDNFKAFYTYISRSKHATIIVDADNVVETKYKISNGKADTYSTTFEPLTAEVIQQTKEKRIEDLKLLLGDNPITSKYDDFKWKIGGETTEEPILASRFVMDKDEFTEPILAVKDSKSQKESEKAIDTGDFKVLVHTFYNNPNAIINSDGTISVNNDNTPFDLNVVNDVTDIEKAKKVIKSWQSLKNRLINNNSDTRISSNEAPDYLKEIFVELQQGSIEFIDIEYVMTVSRYDDTINSPYQKKGFIKEKTLKNNDLFINYSAKLTLGQKTHYVTLGTFGTQENIEKKASEMGYNVNAITSRFSELEKTLANKKLLELKIDDLSQVNFLTGTLLAKINRDRNGNVVSDEKSGKREEYSLDTLGEAFPGLNYSEIRFYPGNIDAFKNLIRKYTFGKEREFNDVEWEDYFRRLKNKPYIVVSYDNDLNGNITGTTTKASLIPIGSHKRSINTIIKEVEDLLDQRQQEIHDDITNKREPIISDELNARTETLLNRSDIMDVLITWGTTWSGNKDNNDETLLDLLTKEITFSASDQITGNKTSVFEIFSRFKTNVKPRTNENFLKVIERVKDAISKNKGEKDMNKAVKQNVIHSLDGTQFWHWSFFNIFGYKKILSEAKDKEFIKLMLSGVFNDDNYESLTDSKGATEMENILGKLIDAVSSKQFYYSIPIKPGALKGEIKANSFISGENGFNKNNFGDKFFINVAPESPKLLIGINTFLNAAVAEEKKPVVTTAAIKPVAIGKHQRITKNYPSGKEARRKMAEDLLTDSNNGFSLNKTEQGLVNEFKEEPIVNVEPEIEIKVEPIAGKLNSDMVKAQTMSFFTEPNDEFVATYLAAAEAIFPYLSEDVLREISNIATSTEFDGADNSYKAKLIFQEIGLEEEEFGVSPKNVEITLGLTPDQADLIIDISDKINELFKLCN